MNNKKRFVGFLVAWFGLMLVTGPASVAPDIIPCVGPMIGDLVGCVLGLAMFGVAMCYACVIAAVAWLRFRLKKKRSALYQYSTTSRTARKFLNKCIKMRKINVDRSSRLVSRYFFFFFLRIGIQAGV